MKKFGKIMVGVGVALFAYEIGKYAGAAISMKQALRKSPELEKISCKFGCSELTIYQSKKEKK